MSNSRPQRSILTEPLSQAQDCPLWLTIRPPVFAPKERAVNELCLKHFFIFYVIRKLFLRQKKYSQMQSNTAKNCVFPVQSLGHTMQIIYPWVEPEVKWCVLVLQGVFVSFQQCEYLSVWTWFHSMTLSSQHMGSPVISLGDCISRHFVLQSWTNAT